MNGGGKRRFPMTASSILVLVVSVVTAQQVFDSQNGQFIRRQPQFRPQEITFQQQNRNFFLPSSSSFRHRSLFTRQISHRHRPRHRSTSSILSSSTHQPTSSNLTPSSSPSWRRVSSRTKPPVHSNQRKLKNISNISRRPAMVRPQSRQQSFPFRFQPRPQPPRVLNPQFPAFRGPIRNVPISSPNRSFPIQAPLSPMPFGSVQRPIPRRLLTQNNMRLSVRPPPTPPSTPPLLSTTTSFPSTTSSSSQLIPITSSSNISSSTSSVIHSVGGSLRRPILVSQLNLNLRRKPQMTRGQFRRIRPTTSKFPHIRHQPTHRVKPFDRVTRPLVSTTKSAETTAISIPTTSEAPSTTTLETDDQKLEELKQIDDIEAAILAALTESSSPPPPTPITHRPRRIRPNQKQRLQTPPPVDAIEEAVLRAVIEATPVASEDVTTTTTATTTSITSEDKTTTIQTTETTSLFPAFAKGRQEHRHRTTVVPTTETTPNTTEEQITFSTEESSTTSTTSIETTITAEESLTTTVKSKEIVETTSEDPSKVTIAVPENAIEDEKKVEKTEEHQLHQIEENLISALTTTTSPVPPSPITAPSPPEFTPSSSLSPPAFQPSMPSESSVGPPGSMPPSDDIVDELNGSSDFLQAAQRLHLLRRLLQ